MNRLLRLLKPHKGLFVLAWSALLVASLFGAILSALVVPLINQILADDSLEAESRTDELLNINDMLAKVEKAVDDLGIPLEISGLGGDEVDLGSPLAWALLAVILFAGQALFDFLGSYTMGRIGITVIVDMRQQLIEKVMSLSMRYFSTASTGELIARINNDVIKIQQAISVKVGEFIRELGNMAVYTLVAFYLNWKLALALFILVPLVGGPISVFSRKIRKYSSKSQDHLGLLTSHLKEVLVGVRIVKGFRRESYEARRLRERNDLFLKYALRELRVVTLTPAVMGIVGMIIIVFFVTIGSVIIQKGQMTSGDYIYFIIAIYSLYQPLKRIARANSEIQQAVGVLPRIDAVLNETNEIEEPAEPKRFANYPKVEEIELDNVCFHYEQNQDTRVLDHVNLKISSGMVVALVGPSGSGKSSLVGLLPRFYDVISGAVRINGLDIRDLSKSDLRGLFAMVTQDTILFDESVHANIAYGADNVPREDVVAAAKQAFAHDFITALPKGYDTTIGEAGSQLSGGQKQRLSIARAILSDAPILILDEATSALDTESEREVQLALDNLMKTKTTFVIAHRLSTIRKAHLIVVLDKGRIVETGSHESLIAEDGLYKRLLEMQKEGQLD